MKKAVTTSNDYIERATDQGVDEVIERYKKLPQNWLIYTSMVNQIRMLHMAIKTNDLSLKFKCWND